MPTDLFEIVPAERRDGARAAVSAAFGKAVVSSLEPLLGGASGAAIYRLEAGGRPYVLRLDKPADGFRDPVRHYACMTIAAEAGVAPALHHADPKACVAVMDFVRQRPIADYPGGPGQLAGDLGRLVGRLQAAPAFPTPRADYLTAIQYMLGMARNSTLFTPGLLDPHLEAFQRIRAAYRLNPEAQVASHNDPNPRNLLYDGERLWLVDWELSYRNDRFVDAAILADNFAATPELETELLTGWLGRAPDAHDRAHLTLMRPLTRLFYACLGLAGAAMTPRETPDDLTAPSVEDFTAAVRDGRLAPTGVETLYVLGKMMLAGFMDAATAPGFDAALARAAEA